MTEPQLPIEYWDSGEVSRNKINNSWTKLLEDVEAFRPSIWENWNWYIWETDTGIQAEWYETEFRVNGWYIQYKTSADNDWTNLIAISELKWDTWASIVSWEFSWDDLNFTKDNWETVVIEWAKTTLKWDPWNDWEDWQDWASIVSWEFSWNDLEFTKDDGNVVVIEWAKNILTWPQWAPWTDWTDWTDGRWIESITHEKSWKDTTVTIEYDDWSEADEFVISDWTDGTDWTDWRWIESITSSKSWKVTTVAIEYDDWTEADSFQISDWTDGTDWQDWEDWNWIASVTSSKSWKITTVTMDFTDPNMQDFSFTVSDWEDWEWAWDVLWPNSSTDGNVVLFDWASGKYIKDSWKALTPAGIWALPDSTKYWATFELSINSSTYVVTATLKDQDWNTLGTAQTIDLPLESVVVSGSYDSATKKVILTLQSWSTIEFSVADLVSWLQTEITSSNKLDADLVDDSTSTNKFVTASDITKLWNLSWVNTGDQSANDFDIKDLADSTNKRSTWDWKQDALSLPNSVTSGNAVTFWADKKTLQDAWWAPVLTSWNQTINWTKTFWTSPVVPSKDTDASSSNKTVIATEAQVAKKQNALTTQTAYTEKGTATKVPQITTNNLWQVTGITEVDITHPSQVDNTAYDNTWDWVTNKAPSQNSVYDKISSMDTTIGWKITNPSGWTAWQYLKKTAQWEEWANVEALPSWWTVGQVLTKTQSWADWEDPTGWIVCDPNSPITITKIRCWTESQYSNLWTYDSSTAYMTI